MQDVLPRQPSRECAQSKSALKHSEPNHAILNLATRESRARDTPERVPTFVEIAEGLSLCSNVVWRRHTCRTAPIAKTKVMACPLPRLGNDLDIQGSTTGHSRDKRDIWDIEAPVYAVLPISAVSASSAM